MKDEEIKRYITKILLRHDGEIKTLIKTLEKTFWRFENKIKELKK